MKSTLEKLQYGLDDIPPLYKMPLLALQLLFVVAIYIILVSFVTKACNLPVQQAQGVISMTMFMMGVATVLQANKGIGSGFLVPSCPAIIYFVSSMIAAKSGGISLVLGMTIFAGFVQMIFSMIFFKVRFLFPPVVTGLTFAGLGLAVGLMALKNVMIEPTSIDNSYLFYASFTITFISIFILSIWGKGLLKLMCLMIGLIVGLIFSYYSGLFEARDIKHFQEAQLLSFPSLSYWGLSFSWNLLPLFLICGIAAGLRSFGSLMTASQINFPDQLKADNDVLKKGVFSDGLSVVLSGSIGAYGVGISPSAVGVTKASGATSRVIAYAIGGFCILFSLSPKISAFWMCIPASVVSGGLLVTSCIMFAGGLRLMNTKPLDLRNTYIIGLSILLALSPMLYPSFYHQLPSLMQIISHSFLSMISIVAIILNVLLYPGKRKKAKIIIGRESAKIEDTLEHINQIGIQGDFAQKTVAQLHDLINTILEQKVNDSDLVISFSHDDVTFMINISYPGIIPRFESNEKFTSDNMLEDQVYILGLSSMFKDNFPDRLSYQIKDGQCNIRLLFSV